MCTKNKHDQSNPKNGGQTPKPSMPLAARHLFQRVCKLQILITCIFSGPSHVQSCKRSVESNGHQKHVTHGQWSSAARVSMSKGTKPWFHESLGAFQSTDEFFYQSKPRPKNNLQAKHRSPPLPPAALPLVLNMVQNPDPNKVHQVRQTSCSRRNTSTKIMLSRYLTIRRCEKKLIKTNWMDGSTMDGL